MLLYRLFLLVGIGLLALVSITISSVVAAALIIDSREDV